MLVKYVPFFDLDRTKSEDLLRDKRSLQDKETKINKQSDY